MEKKIQTIASLSTHSFSAHLDEVLLRDGKVGKRVKIDHPEAAAVIPFISDHEIIMVRQFRYALGRETLEIPAGKVDPAQRGGFRGFLIPADKPLITLMGQWGDRCHTLPLSFCEE